MPPTNIEASPCTRVIGLPAGNHRGPGVPWMRSRCRAPSGPATRRNSSAPRRSRTFVIDVMVRGYGGGGNGDGGGPTGRPPRGCRVSQGLLSTDLTVCETPLALLVKVVLMTPSGCLASFLARVISLAAFFSSFLAFAIWPSARSFLAFLISCFACAFSLAGLL